MKLGIYRIFYFSKLENLGNLRNFANCKFFEYLKLEIFEMFQIGNFVELAKLQIFGIFEIENFSNFPNRKLSNFPNSKFLKFLKSKFLEFYKLEIFGISQNGNFWNFTKWKFLELRKTIFQIFRIENFLNLPNWIFCWIGQIEIFGVFQIDDF